MNPLEKFSKSRLYYSELLDVINFLNKSVRVPFCVAGGALTNILINQKPNDYDIYFLNEDDFITSKHFLDNSPLVESESEMGKHGSSGYNGVYYTHRSSGYKLNIVRGFYGSPEHVISQFDLSICCLAVDRNLNVYTIPSMDLDKIHRSMLLDEDMYVDFRHVHDVYATTGRALKYAKRGFAFRPKDLVGLADHHETMPQFDYDDITVRQDLSRSRKSLESALHKVISSSSPNVDITIEAVSAGHADINVSIRGVSTKAKAVEEMIKRALTYEKKEKETLSSFIVYDPRFDSPPDDLPTPNFD
jgi:hypothetical protein